MKVLEVLVALVLIALLAGMAGLAATWALRRGWKGWAVVTAASGACAFVIALLFLSGSHWDAPTAWRTAEDYLVVAREAEAARWPDLGMPPENLPMFRHFFTQFIVLSFPAWILLACFVVGMFSSQGASALLSRISTKVEPPRPFRMWTLPDPMVFGFLAGCLLKLFRPDGAGDHHWQNLLANNLLVLFTGLYSIGGLSIVSHYFHRWRFPFFVRLMGYLLLFNLASLAAACFGILDVWFDFRRIKNPVPREVKS